MDGRYLERIAEDIATRATSIVLNNQTVPIRSISRNGAAVTVRTESVKGITRVSSLRLYDESGGLIAERQADVPVSDGQRLEFRFNFAIREGAR
ncbi:hypothetical protein AYJ08_06075 [Brevibacillus sp. SKDU10]|uniref:hypothetical protein n=1 Tax=Brevibacillus sp. SKDU10 TaxID=1247872 RepID=UPI0007C88DEF|nr:hypothetical protein [Brevibacillus sp. SKDU10]OAJ75178.1 hypothetical protein AYJ08_06075 [Brevibacillus sp. SKDU10]